MATRDIPNQTDYIVIGGGSSGLIVACRLSEDPNVHVTVVEAGPDGTQDPRVQNPDAWFGLIGSDLDWKMKTVPQVGLNNRVQEHPAGKVLGGSSSINGLAFVPPSPMGINAWAKLGNDKWTWDSLRPSLQKCYTLTAPDELPSFNQHQPSLAQGPIQLSSPLSGDKAGFKLVEAWNHAFKSHGYRVNDVDILNEDSTIGARPLFATIDPKSGLRSSAASQYGALAASRPNVTIITKGIVQKILFDDSPSDILATGILIEHDGKIAKIETRREVILAAGAFCSPMILEHSGIGDSKWLEHLGIPLKINQPNVGRNLQNHLMTMIPIPIKGNSDLEGIQPGFKGLGSLRIAPDEQKELLAAYPDIKSTSENVIRSIIESPNEPSASSFLVIESSDLAFLGIINSYPFSRGNLHSSPEGVKESPIIDMGFLSNELDLEILARNVRNMYKLISSSELTQYLDPDQLPTDLESIKASLRANAMTTHHICGTVAMLPRLAGGVVDQDLKVYGTQNVRVVDASVFPLIPHANPLATVYAVAERAADSIRRGWAAKL